MTSTEHANTFKNVHLIT